MGKRQSLKQWWAGEQVSIHVRGRLKMPGYINVGPDGVREFRKRLKEQHILRLPPAICIDVDLLNWLEEQKGVRRVVCYYKRHYYSASTSMIRDRGWRFDRRYNKQYALAWGAWAIDGHDAGEVQPALPMEPPSKPKPEVELPDYLMD